MHYLLRIIFFIYIAFSIHCDWQIAVFLILCAGQIFRAKYHDYFLIMAVEAIIVFAGACYHSSYLTLLGLYAYDSVKHKQYWMLGVIVFAMTAVFGCKDYSAAFLLIATCSILSYMITELADREEQYKKSYDSERKYRYELEVARTKLLNSSKEIAHITEIKERNRIAREIHDNIGHSIAAVLFQLQAALKLKEKDDRKSMEFLQSSIDQLSNTLTMLRDTVHNIKPREKLGIEYIKSIIENFAFCPVNFNCSGDFNLLSPNHMEIMYTNIKEALTNTAKHSSATEVDIRIGINDRFARLYIKDNGKGCLNIKESMGIGGIRERVENTGGTISVSGEDGFLIVCMLPVKQC